MPISSLFDVEGKVIVITGSTSGIGLMVARGLVKLGAHVVVSSRKQPILDEVYAELSQLGQCTAIRSDVSNEEGCKALYEAVAERFDHVDVLVNCAAVTWGAPLAEHDTASWDRVYNTNVAGMFHCTKFFEPLLLAASKPDAPAKVINFSSAAGIMVPTDPTFSYSSSKAAIIMLTRHLAKHLAPAITVNCVAPGPFHSRMMKRALEEQGEEIAAGTPMKRIGTDDDMIGALVFLSSWASNYMTGELLVMDGGTSSLVSSGS